MADPSAARQFAVSVVRTLRDAGHQALWAGGCVRDQLLGRSPKDYDVATDARPEQIREVFGRRRTLAIGAAFGVITVLGPKRAGQIEVATFRTDADYSDGRRPDSVTFSTAEEDASRRDFTINGMFYDPLDEVVLDYVGGQEDLRRQQIRAIGSADKRIAEDKLRMLRCVRFASTLGFAIAGDTLAAVQRHAGEITVVSAERIAIEMRRILSLHADRGLQLLAESGLLEHVLPELLPLLPTDSAPWQRIHRTMWSLPGVEFPVALAGVLRLADDPPASAVEVGRRWRLANNEFREAERLLAQLPLVLAAPDTPWPQLQRVLAADGAERLLQLAAAALTADERPDEPVAWCRRQMARPRHQWDPPPLISGDDVKQQGIPPGPHFAQLLEEVRDLQLLGRLGSRDAALQYVNDRYRELRHG